MLQDDFPQITPPNLNITIIFMNEKMQNLIKETLGETGNIILNKPENVGFKKQIVDKNMKAYLLIKENK